MKQDPASELLIPVRVFRSAPGGFRWPKNPVLASASRGDRIPLEQLAGDLKSHLGLRARREAGAWGPSAVRIRRTVKARVPDGYTLRILPDGVEIEAATDAGAYYAVQTLRQWLAIQGPVLSCGEAVDSPDFTRRAVYLDCSRGKVPTVDTVRRLIEHLASCKINELQLYVENVFTFRRHPDIGRGFDPFTPEDLFSIQEHARLHHVRFVPSLTSFGHFERILMLPPYRALGEFPGHYGMPGGTTLCPTDPRSIRLVEEMYDEYLPLFDALDFNACCDETWELGKGRSADRARRVGVGRLYLDHLLRLHRLCLKHGKRMNVWADIVLDHPETIPELPRDLVLLNWDYHAHGLRIPKTRLVTEAGFSCVVCPGTHAWQSHGTRMRAAMDNVRVFAAEGRRRGADGLMQTDWGDRGHRNPLGVSLHGFAHAAAHAWNGRAVDEAAFTERFARRWFGSAGGAVADALRDLGANEDRMRTNAYESLAWKTDGSGLLFRGISRRSPVWFKPLSMKETPWIRADRSGAREAIAACGRADRLLSGVSSTDPFLERALEDLRLASTLDRVAARRILASKNLSEGHPIALPERRAIREDLLDAKRRLRATWLASNRPSRLRDNLRLIDNQVEDLAD
jgi:hypothetical protein